MAEMTILQHSLHDTQTAILADIAAHSGTGPTAADLASFPAMQKFVAGQIGGKLPEAELRQTFNATKDGGIGSQKTPSFVYDAIINGEHKYGASQIPVLIIEAYPVNPGKGTHADSAKLAASRVIHDAKTLRQLQAFQAANPLTKIIKIPHAYHYIYLSNEAEVLKAIQEFIKE